MLLGFFRSLDDALICLPEYPDGIELVPILLEGLILKARMGCASSAPVVGKKFILKF